MGRGSRRDYRRVVETLRDNSTGTGAGASGASQLVQEEDGISFFLLEEGNGTILTEEQ